MRLLPPRSKVFFIQKLNSFHRMATFNDRLALYKQSPNAQRFTPNQIKRLHNNLTWVFNRHRPGYAHSYVEAQEGGKTCRVRNYPEEFTPTIDGLINKLHAKVAGSKKSRERKRIAPRPVKVWASDK